MDKITFLFLFIAVIGSCTAVNNSCTSVGKFIADSNCTSYVVCSLIDNQFTSYTIPCPPGFKVRHSDMVCSKSGTHCEPSYACTSVGNFTNPVSVNSSMYISCIQGIGDNIIATVMECPAPLEFNATVGSCQLQPVQGIGKELPDVQGTVNASAVMPSTSVNSAIPTNVQVEAVTEVVPPSIAATTKQRTNGSVTIVASHHTVLAAVSAFFLFYKF